MNKHTPGPWIALKNGNVGIFDHSETQSYGMVTHICYIEKYDHPESHAANARLIAAAPELLEALTLILNLNDHDVWTDESWQVALNMTRAAIAKVTGDN